MRRYALRDDQWERIKDLLLGRKATVGVTAKDDRYGLGFWKPRPYLPGWGTGRQADILLP
jgi:hypothetical protein